MPEPGGATEICLGFDLGTRELGVALGNRLTSRARPLRTLAMQPESGLWLALQALVQEWAPQTLVVGLPLTLDGAEQPMSTRARAFAQQLHKRFGLPVHVQDERGSTQLARRRFASERAAGNAKRKHAADIDAHAAAVILEDYLATAGS